MKIFLPLLCVCFQALGDEEFANRPFFSREFSFHGETWRTAISIEEILSARAWRLGQEEAPVSPARAYRRSLRALQKLFPSLKELTMLELELRSQIFADGQHHAWYALRFGGPSIGSEQFEDVQVVQTIYVVVLMDGKVITPSRVHKK